MTKNDVSIEITFDNSGVKSEKSSSQKHWLWKTGKDITDVVSLPKAKIAVGFAIGMAVLYVVTHYPDGNISKIGNWTSGSDLSQGNNIFEDNHGLSQIFEQLEGSNKGLKDFATSSSSLGDVEDSNVRPKSEGDKEIYQTNHLNIISTDDISDLTEGKLLKRDQYKKKEADNLGKELSKRRSHSENQNKSDSNYNDTEAFLVGTAMLVGIPTITCFLTCCIMACRNKRQANGGG